MAYKKLEEFPVEGLTKKYRFDVPQVIRFWKKNKSDMEIASTLGIDLWKLRQLRNELIQIRQEQRAKNLNQKF